MTGMTAGRHPAIDPRRVANTRATDRTRHELGNGRPPHDVGSPYHAATAHRFGSERMPQELAVANSIGGGSHRQIRKIVKPPWCAVPTRGVGGIVNSKVLFRRHAVKPNVTELRSHKGSWQIQPRNSRWLASVVGKTHRNASANLFWAFVMPALRIIDTPFGSPKDHYVNPPTRGFSRMPKERRSRSLAVSPPTPPGWQCR